VDVDKLKAMVGQDAKGKGLAAPPAEQGGLT
jgi:hypothetical protein